jgi:hypothetical protein
MSAYFSSDDKWMGGMQNMQSGVIEDASIWVDDDIIDEVDLEQLVLWDDQTDPEMSTISSKLIGGETRNNQLYLWERDRHVESWDTTNVSESSNPVEEVTEDSSNQIMLYDNITEENVEGVSPFENALSEEPDYLFDDVLNKTVMKRRTGKAGRVINVTDKHIHILMHENTKPKKVNKQDFNEKYALV